MHFKMFQDHHLKLLVGIWRNPIYGPFGISESQNVNSGIKTLTSGYSVSVSNIEDRPSLQEYPLGSFVEDYVFDNSGDLDVHNGRFEINADFPNGVYAYHAVVDSLTKPNLFFHILLEKLIDLILSKKMQL